MWHFIGTHDPVPKNRNLMVAVLNHDGMHGLEFPCQFRDGIWIDMTTGRTVEVNPTHWREWGAS